MLIAIALVFAGCSGKASCKKALEEYLGAVKKRDFETIYRLNARVQKKIALIYRGDEEHLEESLKTNYEEFKQEFEAIEASRDLRGLWAEKFIITPESNFTVSNVRIEEESGSPTSKFKYNDLGNAEIIVEYNSEDSAPSLGGRKVKKMICTVVLIQGKDVVQGIKTKATFPEWVFQSISVVSGTVTYW